MCPRVLICDDAMFMRTVIARGLEGAGWDVIAQVSDGAEAIKRVEELRPDFVTMDLVMPEMNGVDAVRGIRAVDADVCILVVSALGQEQIVREAIEAGASGVLRKPFELTDLVATAQKVLDECAGRRASA